MTRIIERMNMRHIGIAYGRTETSSVSFQTSMSDPAERRVATIGRAQPQLELKIVEPATGETVPMGEPGEMCTRGSSVMIGWWGDPERTAKVIREGWTHTGDRGVMDDGGFGQIVGQIKA